jgi:hypothetical protein
LSAVPTMRACIDVWTNSIDQVNMQQVVAAHLTTASKDHSFLRPWS